MSESFLNIITTSTENNNIQMNNSDDDNEHNDDTPTISIDIQTTSNDDDLNTNNPQTPSSEMLSVSSKTPVMVSSPGFRLTSPSSTTHSQYSTTTKRSTMHRSRPFNPNSITYKVLHDIAKESSSFTCTNTTSTNNNNTSTTTNIIANATNANTAAFDIAAEILPASSAVVEEEENNIQKWVNEKIALITSIHDNIVGGEAVLKSPFNNTNTNTNNTNSNTNGNSSDLNDDRYVPITYCDYIASGKPLKFIEDYLFEQVLPTYANTHTTTSFTGYQTSHFREDARQIIAQCVNARLVPSTITTTTSDSGGGSLSKSSNFNSNCSMCSITSSSCSTSCSNLPSDRQVSDENCDVVLFVGSGSTSAIATLVHCIGLRERVLLSKSVNDLPIVFISCAEHHSNILPWRESGALVIQISEDRYGNNINLAHLEECLSKYKHSNRLLIGSFTAASNVTGVISDCDSICRLCHENGALCFFDYAASAPYVPINVNPTSNPLYHKDAIFISPHKFVGGPSTPGVLIAKRKLFKNAVPMRPGGGTVYFVDDRNHSYTSSIEEREEGGTPDIIGSIRCALVFKLKDTVGPQLIGCIEDAYRERAYETFSKNTNLILLGPNGESFKESGGGTGGGGGSVKKLAFFSFLVKHGNSFLHHSFVSLLLNDLFGIQTRGGCSCAGPLGMEILGITHEKAVELENALMESYLSNNSHSNNNTTNSTNNTVLSLTHLKPGWTRLNLNYFFDDETVDFVVKAVDFVASNGWMFLPYYIFNEKSNEWMHRRFTTTNTTTNTNMNMNTINNNTNTSGNISIHEDFTNFLQEHRKKLTDITFENGKLKFLDHHSHQLHNMEPSTTHYSYTTILKDAELLLKQSIELFTSKQQQCQQQSFISYEQEVKRLFGNDDYYVRKYGHLRWYLLPSQVLAEMRSNNNSNGSNSINGNGSDDTSNYLIKPKSYPTSQEYVDDKIIHQTCYNSVCQQSRLNSSSGWLWILSAAAGSAATIVALSYYLKKTKQ